MGLVYVRKVAEHTRRSEPKEASQWSSLLHGFCFQVLLCVPPLASLTGRLTCELKQTLPFHVSLVLMSITATKYELVKMLLTCTLQNTPSRYVLPLTFVWTQPHMHTLPSSSHTFILHSGLINTHSCMGSQTPYILHSYCTDTFTQHTYALVHCTLSLLCTISLTHTHTPFHYTTKHIPRETPFYTQILGHQVILLL